ncbi:MAG: hypothetical protein DRJ21_01785 [Candidatus Methanomethylicota archaeon]|uniref:Uncharacterized protein n=1 Tax=Thermoproteota archaeon TaxID=2056631 RepID=A0A497EUC4_9CREN|nr:MAG: hypothetical protein DRJ21_01785 [Candidatus Verstraetearchaeota archaeon]
MRKVLFVAITLLLLINQAKAELINSTIAPIDHKPIEVEPITNGTEILIIKDVEPWFIGAHGPAIEAVLNELGKTYDIINSGQLRSVDLSKYKIIIVASDQYTSTYNNLIANKEKLAEFVYNGGILIAHACDHGWHEGVWIESWLPLGVTKVNEYTNTLSIIDSRNPIINGTPHGGKITDEGLDEWCFSTHGYFTNLPPGTRKIIGISPNPEEKPTYIIYSYGSGFVLATMQTIEWAWSGGQEYWGLGEEQKNLLRNEIEYALVLALDIDKFSFTNAEFSEWARSQGICTFISLQEIIDYYTENPPPFKTPSPFYWLLYLIGKKSHELGHCYGMSAAALDYYLHPEKIPNGKKVHELTMEEAANDIEYYQTHWIFDIDVVTKGLMLFSGLISPKDEFEFIKKSLYEGKPVIVALYCPEAYQLLGISFPGFHNVVEYKFEEYEDEIIDYVYDPNYENQYYELGGSKIIYKYFIDDTLTMGYYYVGDLKCTRFASLTGAVDYSIWDKILYILVHSPVELHVYNPQGKHVGLKEGKLETQFPAVYIQDEEEGVTLVVIPRYETGKYTIKLVGKESGRYNMTIASVFNGITYEKTVLGEIDKDEEEYYTASISQEGVLKVEPVTPTEIPEFTPFGVMFICLLLFVIIRRPK